ncbi:FG-GAP-like repeat-containing protein [Okeania sp. SIO1I7]|uniref:FG-GAP-like repeat-containing protein n=1 Tax=Okeania sp. SIO1I7 TaxID=2607772 RepID=UPI0013FCB4E9|nr:FG-GAP-like repeat-containing protein [Okeania sp. SIO1I7]NET25475.1 DUF642 domain-containing protein [Okeania sp. SIO1I7]
MAFSRWLQKTSVAETTMANEFNSLPQLKQTLGKCFRVVLAVVMAVAMFVMPITTVHAAPTIEFIDSGQALGNYDSRDASLADLDGDGDLDAFVANYYHPNKVWLNDGSSNFTDSGQNFGNSYSLDVSLADLDGDGDIDAFVTNDSNRPNKVWLNDGSANFTDSGQNLGDDNGVGLDLADVDEDGDIDAFFANFDRPNEVLLNDGSGNFTDSGQNLGDSDSYDVSLADVDGDGDFDAFIVNLAQPNEVWLNDGSGNFTDSGQNLGNYSSYDVSLADLDGDGDIDAFVTNGVNPNKVWLNDSSGNFTDSGQNLGDSNSRGISLGDVDGDGDFDAFVTNSGEPNKVWLNDGSANFTDSGQNLGNYNSQDVSLGDVDADGDLDAFIANSLNDPNKVWLNNLDEHINLCDNVAPNNLVVNGSFETPEIPTVPGYSFERAIEGWELVSGPFIEIDNRLVTSPYDGLQLVDLDSLNATTKISQTISTQPGETYKLTFAFKGNDDSTVVEDNTMDVYWGDELVEAFDQVDSETWEVKTYNLEATSTETVLSFDNFNDITDGAGTRLDGVSVNLCQY